ncbi:MAG: hypothetical protein KGP28_13125 [Bdellovibrionales bacterium]|nr:hypothetical protein [Bdellovibrionales bacterium]
MKSPVLNFVPGKGATEFFNAFASCIPGSGENGPPHFYHEEIAYTVAHGASLTGSPSLCFVKSHGIAKAMNSVIASLHSGTAAPMVVFTFEDKDGSSSDHPFQSAAMLSGAGATVLPLRAGSLFSDFKAALNCFFQIKCPVFLSIKTGTLPDPTEIQTFASEALALLASPPEAGPVPRYQALLNPLLSPRFSAPLPRIPNCPQDLPPHLISTAKIYEPAIVALKRVEYSWVTGDAGTSSLFGLPPHDFVNVCTHMGAAIPLAMGAVLSGRQRVLAVTGDFSFLSTGALSLAEAKHRGLSFDVLIFQNGIAAATGGQIVDHELLESQIPNGIEVHRLNHDPAQLFELLKNPSESKVQPRVVLYETPT